LNPLLSIDGLAGWLVVSVPSALLVAVAFSTFRTERRTRIDEPVAEAALSAAGASEARARLLDDTVVADGDATYAGATHVETTDAAAAGSKPVHEERRSGIAEEIAAAECAGDRDRLMQLLLELALIERATGDDEVAKDLLRKSIMIASETGDVVVQAKGRLELGDIAQSQGDLTTACEHWQMARALFDQAECADARREVETRMQTQGCPTDWVLTDF